MTLHHLRGWVDTADESPKTVTYAQTPAVSSAGLVATNEAYLKDKGQKQGEIHDLKNALNDLPSAEQELYNRFLAGKEMFVALQQKGEDAVQKKIDEFNAYENHKNTDGRSGFHGTTFEVTTKFRDLSTKSDAEIDEKYLQHFEPQHSRYYFGNLLSDADHEAFKNGFFSALSTVRNWVAEKWLSDELMLASKIIDKLTAAQKRHQEYISGEYGKVA